MYILIEHINGEISSDPFIVFNESDLEEYINGEYLIYYLDNGFYDFEKNIIILKEYEL